MSCEPLAMALPLLPAGMCGTAQPAALKTNSLSRMDELQQHLARCDDPSYLKSYVKVIQRGEFLHGCVARPLLRGTHSRQVGPPRVGGPLLHLDPSS